MTVEKNTIGEQLNRTNTRQSGTNT